MKILVHAYGTRRSEICIPFVGVGVVAVVNGAIDSNSLSSYFCADLLLELLSDLRKKVSELMDAHSNSANRAHLMRSPASSLYAHVFNLPRAS